MVSSSYRFAFLLDLFFGLVNLLIYYFISRTFEDVSTDDLQGAPSYFAFAAVGVALGLVIQSAGARLAQRLREEQLTGALEILTAQPVTAAELAFGLAGFHFAFAVLRAIVYLVVAGFALDADLSDADWLGFAVMMVTTGLAMAAIGIALAAAVVVLKRAELLSGVVLLALSLLGGAYFPVDVLPGWLQPIADILPTTFAFSGVRNALYTGEDWGVPALELVAFAVVALPVAIAIFRLGLDHARARGSLATP
jgi:ABC-type multidrug transport system permease subunit